ncbi:MAG: GntR family transcriptional regulator [Lentisphaeria bacterium]|nr:GntR family transcriptional regulator [Lentisphaeria bacterium]
MTLQKTALTEAVRVRHYIMNIIYRSGGHSVRVPSLRKLARELGIAVSTVQLAYDRMIEDGSLYSRQGLGTFTCENRNWEFGVPLIGIKFRDGDQFLLGHGELRELEALTGEFSQQKCNVHFLSRSCRNAGEFQSEAESASLNGLITYFSQAARGVKLSIPHVNVGTSVAGASNIIRYYHRAIVPFAKMIRPEGGIVVMGTKNSRPILHSTLTRECGREVFYLGFDGREMEHIIALKPSAILTEATQLASIRKRLREAGISEEQCLTVSVSELPPYFEEPAWYFEEPTRETAALAVHELQRRMADPAGAPTDFCLEHEFRFFEPHNSRKGND